MFKPDPLRAPRNRYHQLLNKGHRFALVESSTGKITMSARRADTLKPFYHWRPDLTLVDVQEQLNALPLPDADSRITPT